MLTPTESWRNNQGQIALDTGKLLGLIDVKNFDAHALVVLLSELDATPRWVEEVPSQTGGLPRYRIREKSTVDLFLRSLQKHCEDAQLPFSLIAIQRLRGLLASNETFGKPLEDYIHELRTRVEDEIRSPRFKIIPAEKVPYFEKPVELFGEGTVAKFRPARNDVEEAGKCYAAGRNTACVFHLMRVMEVGLRALGTSLNAPNLDPKKNPSWDAILTKCGDELRKPLKDRAPEWREDDVFYSTATANLRAVKDAWRNPTMHVEQDYNEETALDAWNAVRAFMRHLATKLSS